MLSLTAQVAAVRNGEVTSTQLVTRALEAIERVEDATNAFTTVLPDDALARARDLERDGPAGPLHGVPVAVKDLYDVTGVVTTGCCRAYEEMPSEDSAVVSRLRRAGAIVVAKTNQHELACGATSLVSSYGPVLNPWDRARIAGGSSGGSGVAVAAGAVAMAMGSDTGGSIRIPSSFCGVTGLKPTHGAVSLRGAMPMCPSLDTAGPLARSAADCALVYSVIAGPDPEYIWSRTGPQLPVPTSFEGCRIGIPKPFFELIDTDVRLAIEDAAKAFESMGLSVVEVGGPDMAEAFTTFASRLAEVAHCYRDLWEDTRISPTLANFISYGRSVTGADFFAGREIGLKVKRDFSVALQEADVLLAPCTIFPPPRIDDIRLTVEGGEVDVHEGGCARLTMPVNIAGLPAVAFPVGFSSAGTPVGAQLIGHEWSELQLCGYVTAYQSETDWHTRVASI